MVEAEVVLEAIKLLVLAQRLYKVVVCFYHQDLIQLQLVVEEYKLVVVVIQHFQLLHQQVEVEVEINQVDQLEVVDP